MNNYKPKISVYLDEISFDPLEALEVLKAYPITSVALRSCWTHNICKLNDNQHKIIKQNLYKKYTVALVVSELGNIPAHELSKITNDEISKAFVIAQYYGAKHLKVHAGTASKHPNANKFVGDWVARISAESVKSGVVPLFEPSHLAHCFKPPDICINIIKPWKILFDPAQLIVNFNLDPFTKYWVLLRPMTDIVDIHDYKIGHGGKLAGMGDARLSQIIDDAVMTDYNGWFILEPGIGKKAGDMVSKNALFSNAYDACKNLFGDDNG